MIFIIYVGVFSLAVAASIVGITRLHSIQDRDTRRGLGALLLLSAGWGVTQIIQIYFFNTLITVISHTIGLIFGVANVGAWLYFCSAYAGHDYHRRRSYRWLSVGLFTVISLFKITNPWHSLYYEYTITTTPFPHLVFQEKPVFWIIAGLMYTLCAVGFYLVYEVFVSSNRDTVRPTLIVGVAFLPVVFDLIGYYTGPPILELNYESIGVAMFALGILFVVKEPFFSLSQFGRFDLFESLQEPIIFTDSDGTVEEYNEAASRILPSIDYGMELEQLMNSVGVDSVEDGTTVALEHDGEDQYYTVTATPIAVGSTIVGQSIILNDITQIERQRRALERKDEQLEGFATAINHELRNAITVIGGRTEVLYNTTVADETAAQPQLDTILKETKKVEEVVQDLETLARYGQTLSETEYISLRDVVESASEGIGNLQINIDGNTLIKADRARLCELFADAFRFAEKNGASNARVSITGYGFDIIDDGRALDSFEGHALFAYGNAIPDADSGLSLPKVRMLAESHGWNVAVANDYSDGMCLEIRGVQLKSASE